MARVKGATHAIKRRRSLLSKTKGYRFGRRTKEKQAKEAWMHARVHAFNHRKAKKGDFRQMWQSQINAAVRNLDESLSYSKFMAALKAKNIELNRKMLGTLAEHHPDTFKRIVESIK